MTHCALCHANKCPNCGSMWMWAAYPAEVQCVYIRLCFVLRHSDRASPDTQNWNRRRRMRPAAFWRPTQALLIHDVIFKLSYIFDASCLASLILRELGRVCQPHCTKHRHSCLHIFRQRWIWILQGSRLLLFGKKKSLFMENLTWCCAHRDTEQVEHSASFLNVISLSSLFKVRATKL